MTVRAKFKVQSRREMEKGLFEVALVPVGGGSEENQRFYHYTPAGNILLATINAEAAEQFKPGKFFYVDFSEAGE